MRVLTAAIMAAMLSDIPYMEADITEHVHSVNFLYVKWLKSVKIASFVPKLANGNGPVRLGQNEGKVKKMAVVFPITKSQLIVHLKIRSSSGVKHRLHLFPG